jgi:hypothetical protein
MRLAAFAHIRQLLELRNALTANDLKPGFQFADVRIPLFPKHVGGEFDGSDRHYYSR